MFFDHHGITDERFGELREQFDDGEIVELTQAIVQFIALGKLIYVLGIPFGDGEQEVVPPERDSQEGATS